MILNVNSLPIGWQIAFGIAPLIFCITGVSISFIIACSRHYDVVMRLVSKNPYLDHAQCAMGANTLKARWLVVCMGCGAVTLSRIYIRQGAVDPEMLKTFPVRLAKWMRLSAIINGVGFIWLMISAALLKLSEM